MAIISRKVCKCAVCPNEWIPAKTKANPKGDPRKVKRCSSCKSFHWNADDPKVIAKRRAKIQPQNDDQRQPGVVVSHHPGEVDALSCKHRVLLSQCQLCQAVQP